MAIKQLLTLSLLLCIQAEIDPTTKASYVQTLKHKLTKKKSNWDQIPAEKQEEIITLSAEKNGNSDYMDLILFTYLKTPNQPITDALIEENRATFHAQ